jgi:hypothetical protein
MVRQPASHGRSRRRALASVSAAVLLFSAAACLSGCGRSRDTSAGDLSALTIARYRVNFDDKHKTSRIMAELRNNGTRTVRKCVVVAILRGAGGEQQGMGRAVVEDIRPGQPKSFSIRADSGGKQRDVEFQILPPGAEEQEPPEETKNAP